MENLFIRRFRNEDAKNVAELIKRNFLEVNIKDYPKEEMEELAKVYNEEKVLFVSSYAHMYVVCVDGEVVGVGAISSFWGSEEESILLTIFVKPELHGQGIGRRIIETLEKDEYFLRARRVEIPESITGCEFYRKFGYDFKDGVREVDDEGNIRLEKFREI